VAADFWALGICLYQFLVGVTPFTDDCPHTIISNIINYRLPWPDNDECLLSDDAIKTIKGLLNYNPTLRFDLHGRKEKQMN
jgi:serine/threonine protein kinase